MRNSTTLRGRVPDSLRIRNSGVVYALLVLVTVLTVASFVRDAPNYLDTGNISNILDQTTLVGILAITTTIVLISGNFDLSIGSVAALGAAVCLLLVDRVGVTGAVLISVALGAAVGLFNGVIVQYVGINAFIVTLGTLTAVRGLVLVLTDGRTITVADEGAKDRLASINSNYWTTPSLLLCAAVAMALAAAAIAARSRADGRSLVTPAASALALMAVVASIAALVLPSLDYALRLSQQTIYMIVLAVVASAVLRYTVVGRRLYATGGSPEAARLSGIAVNRYKILPFVLNGAAAAFVGVLFASRLGSVNPTGLTGFELTALAAAILGGTSLFGGLGTVGKSIVGALILFTLKNGFNVLNLGANYQGLIEGAVLIVAAGIYTVSSSRQAAQPAADDVPTPPALVDPLPAATARSHA